MRITSRSIARDAGFTLVELMTVVLIIGILVAIAVPIFSMNKSQAQKRTCFANQRILEGAVATWEAADEGNDVATLQGPVNSAHPIVQENIVGRAPHCPSGGTPADPDNPTAAEGGYAFDAAGIIDDCALGILGAHGHYN